jgi:cysteine desulfurase
MDVDFLSISAHKFHGPKGAGALYVRRGIRFFPMMLGGSQEHGRRAGTENTAAIVGMGAAASAMRRRQQTTAAELRQMRDIFESKLLAELPGVTRNGHPTERLPNTSHLAFAGCEAMDLIRLLDAAKLECSAGSACMAGQIRPSHVQLAMGFDGARGRSSLRFSFSILNTPAQAVYAADLVRDAVERLRKSRNPALELGIPPISCGISTS